MSIGVHYFDTCTRNGESPFIGVLALKSHCWFVHVPKNVVKIYCIR